MQGFPEKDITKLEDYGFVASRPRGEYHANNQQMAKLLHKAIGLGGKKAAPMVLHICLAVLAALASSPLSHLLLGGHIQLGVPVLVSPGCNSAHCLGKVG